MKQSYKVMIFAALISFLLGAWWSYRQFEKKHFFHLSHLPQIHVLSQKNFFKTDLIEKVQKISGIKMVVTEVEDEQDLLELIYANHNSYDLIHVNSYHATKLIKAKVLKKIGGQIQQLSKPISVDFKNLAYDTTNEYFIPLTWNINGIVYNSSKISTLPKQLEAIFINPLLKQKIAIRPTPHDYYFLFKQNNPFLSQWIESGKYKMILEMLKKQSQFIYRSHQSPIHLYNQTEVHASIITNGEATQIAMHNKDSRFFVPEDSSIMWLSLLAIPAHSNKASYSYQVIKTLLKKNISKYLSQQNHQATVLDQLNNSDLHPYLKASFIRQVPLKGLSLPIDNSASQSIWKKALEQSLPKIFNVKKSKKKQKAVFRE